MKTSNPPNKTTARESQAAMIANNRSESCVDPSIRLGFPKHQPSTERGPTIAQYYAALHRRGIFGTYWPLHQTEQFWLKHQ